MSMIRYLRTLIGVTLVCSALLAPGVASPAGNANIPIPGGFYSGKMKYSAKKAIFGAVEVTISKGEVSRDGRAQAARARGLRRGRRLRRLRAERHGR